jgi:putative phosphoribosyl transferase
MADQRDYLDRRDAGRRLAQELRGKLAAPVDALVLALPRGGLPVGYEVARELELPLDVLTVRKLGLPSQPELAMGAIASGGLRVLNESVLRMADVDEETLEEVESRERRELERREKAYRGDRSVRTLEGRTIILVDDGVATGSTIRAAIRAVRTQGPRSVVVAVPVASPEIASQLRAEADQVVCPLLPRDLFAIGVWYRDFPQLTDDEARDILQRAWREEDLRAGSDQESGPRSS